MNDAAAVCEAAGRPWMRFAPVKSEQQQVVLVVHHLRTATVAEQIRTINQMHRLLAEFGVVAPRGAVVFNNAGCSYGSLTPRREDRKSSSGRAPDAVEIRE